MPVIVESLVTLSPDDQVDLLKIYQDAPLWLTDGTPAEQWLEQTMANSHVHIFGARFNDRLLAAALVTSAIDDPNQWTLTWLTVRKVTRDRGVGQRLVEEIQRIANERHAVLTLPEFTDAAILPSWLEGLLESC